MKQSDEKNAVPREAPRKKSIGTFLLNAPYVVWSALFIIVPIILVACYAFFGNYSYYDVKFEHGGEKFEYEVPYEMDGGSLTLEEAKEAAVREHGVPYDEVVFVSATLENRISGFTLDNMKGVFDSSTGKAMALSFAYSAIATVISLLIGYPFAFALSRSSQRVQRIQMLLIMLPMWMNMLVRTYSWQQILENNGIINKLLGTFGLGPVTMLGTSGAVILGMVYNYLPYMILPIYTIMTKIDTSLLEACDDLGCNSAQKFKRLILPLSVPGVISGMIMVFVPSISTFYISQKMSNGMIKLVGDLIETKIKEQWSSGGLNAGAAMSLVLMVVILICTFIMNRFSDDDTEGMMI